MSFPFSVETALEIVASGNPANLLEEALCFIESLVCETTISSQFFHVIQSGSHPKVRRAASFYITHQIFGLKSTDKWRQIFKELFSICCREADSYIVENLLGFAAREFFALSVEGFFDFQEFFPALSRDRLWISKQAYLHWNLCFCNFRFKSLFICWNDRKWSHSKCFGNWAI